MVAINVPNTSVNPGVTQLVRDGFTLNHGLDLYTPVTFTQPGSLSQCLNYEIGNVAGLRRIDGYHYTDSRLCLGKMHWYTLIMQNHITSPLTFPMYLRVIGQPYPFGVVIQYFNHPSLSDCYVRFFPIDERFFPQSPSDAVEIGNSISNSVVFSGFHPVSGVPSLFDSALFTSFLAVNFPSEVINNASEAVRVINLGHRFCQFGVRSPFANEPVSNVSDYHTDIVGVHLFRDRIYAFCNSAIIRFTNGSIQIHPGDKISVARHRFVVLRVVVQAGSWSSGNASGYLEADFYEYDLGLPTVSNVTVHRPVSGALVAASFSGYDFNVNNDHRLYAVIRKSRNEIQAIDETTNLINVGWARVPTMWFVKFNRGRYNGDTIPVVNRTTGTVNQTAVSGNTSFAEPDGSFNSSAIGFYLGTEPSATAESHVYTTPVSTAIHDAVKTVGGGNLIFSNKAQYLTSFNPNADRRTQRVGLYDVIGASSIPPTATILGMEVVLLGSFHAVNDAHGGYPTVQWAVDSKLLVTLVNGTAKISDEIELPFTKPMGSGPSFGPSAFTITLGSNSAQWGVSGGLTRALLTNPNFGVSLRYFARLESTNHSGPSSSAELEASITIDRVYVVVYYQTTFDTYYFHSGGNDIKASVVACYVTSGRFSDGNAEGVLQVTSLQPLGGMDLNTILSGFTLHTAPGGAPATKIADIVETMSTNAPPSLEVTRQNRGRYRFLTSNFYGDSQWDAFYFVTGASRAYSVDRDFVVSIFTQPDAEKDKPRHVANHHGRLALGFKAGNVDFSVVGEPENFYGQQGATSIALGDEVTGLMSMPGVSLGVFCDKSIWTIRGLLNEEMQTTVLSSTSGAIEYTVASFGYVPIYCDNHGITSLDQSEKYGEFVGNRLSTPVSSIIVPKAQDRVPFSSKLYGDNGILFSLPVRSKNQYRMFFRDGTCLTMTMAPGQGQGPMFTTQKYFISEIYNDSSPSYDFVPRCYSSEVDNKGVERIYMVPESIDDSTASLFVRTCGKYVFEFNRSWSFIDKHVPAYFRTNYYYGKNIFDNILIKKARFEGLTLGVGTLNVRTGKYFNVNSSTGELMSTAVTPMQFPRNERSNVLIEETEAASEIANLAENDRVILIQVETVNRQNDIAGAEPPHVLQAVLVSLATGGKPDA